LKNGGCADAYPDIHPVLAEKCPRDSLTWSPSTSGRSGVRSGKLVAVTTVLVTGGTGTLGRFLVPLLREEGHEVRVLSRRPGAGTHVGDLTTGVGVADAARGADLLVHAASDTRRLGRRDIEQTRHLLEGAPHARHLVYVSIVGIDAIPFAYYRQKLACEGLLASGGVPHTVLRATQFHELIARVLRAAERLPTAPLPLDFSFQTVAAAEVAQRATSLLGGEPLGRTEDLGGPEVLTLSQMAATWRSARGRPRAFVRLPVFGRVGQAFRDGLNTCPEHADGQQTWARFVADSPVVTRR
jgi:uncharacterized protein YbjT (DUF2867 family)